MKMNGRGEESEEKCGPAHGAQKLHWMFSREERVSFREISVSINARPGANELSLIDHWRLDCPWSGVIWSSTAGPHHTDITIRHTVACVGCGTQFNFTARSYFLHFSWIKMKLNSVGGTSSEKCKIAFNTQLRTIKTERSSSCRRDRIYLQLQASSNVWLMLVSGPGDPCMFICLDTGPRVSDQWSCHSHHR